MKTKAMAIALSAVTAASAGAMITTPVAAVTAAPTAITVDIGGISTIDPNLGVISEGFNNGEKNLTLDDIVIGDVLSYDENGRLVRNDSHSSLTILAEDKKDDKKENNGFDWGTPDKTVKYTAQGLRILDVDGDAKMVADYGEAIYGLIKSGSKVDIGGLYKNGKNFLTLVGVLKKDSTHHYSLDEIGQAISELKGAIEALSDEMKLLEQQSYRNGLQSFDNAVIALNTYCNIVQTMMQEAAYQAEAEGVLTVPGEDATAEEQFAYNKALIKYIENSDSDLYKDFKFDIEAVKTNFVIVAGEVSKKKDKSPLTTFDNYVNNYFNFYSQGWAARQAYRSNVELELKRAYAQIAIYHNIGSQETYSVVKGEDVNQAYTNHMTNALQAMEENTAGDKNNKYSPTLGTNSSDAWVSGYGKCVGGVSKDQMKAYYKRLNGRTIREDLELAGYNVSGWDEAVWNNKKSGLRFNFTKKNHVGGLFGKIGGTQEYYIDVLHWDGTIETGVKVNDNNYYWGLSYN